MVLIGRLSQRFLSPTAFNASIRRAAMAVRAQPDWQPPSRDAAELAKLPPLKLFNSLTRNKDLFVPANGNRIEWYGCGPTVYDMSHMGHARTYISFDIIRRVLRDYFHYDVHYVMNITDIDDKIIKRARQNHLFELYKATAADLNALISDVGASVARLKAKLAKETDADKRAMLQRDVDKVEAALAEPSLPRLLSDARDPLSDWLDSERGSTVTDNEIFERLPRHFEAEYFADMRALNVEDPDKVVRVSECVPDIVLYCQRIVEQGYAYESNGSVYFDTNRFNSAPNHFYAKLVPNAFGDQALLMEGEGDLSQGQQEKKSPADFALWKASRPGEPSWPSPWGAGRPGWHIECSVMASNECGQQLDLHSGGVDLKFPHHDNELAQAEAYYDSNSWVNYFLHSGHLTIEGCKMSKSLKNFITIRQALERHSCRRLRLAFLLHSWRDTLDYSEETMRLAGSFLRLFADYRFNVAAAARLVGEGDGDGDGDGEDAKFAAQVDAAPDRVREFLCDSVDTRSVLLLLQELVFAANSCLAKRPVAKQRLASLRQLNKIIDGQLELFGAGEQESGRRKDLPLALLKAMLPLEATCDQAGKAEFSAVCRPVADCLALPGQRDANSLAELAERVGDSRPESLDALLQLLADCRLRVRQDAIARKLRSVLEACDAVRDIHLPRLGVRLQDRDADGLAAVQFYPQELLDEEIRDRETREAKQREAKAAKQAAKAAQEERGCLPAEQLFVGDSKYSKFDKLGIPTHAADGKELSKSQLKKVRKLYEAQRKKNTDWKAKQSGESKPE